MICPAEAFADLQPHAPGQATWTVRPDLPYLEGHFPGNPILPAIAIIDASAYLLQQDLGVKKWTVKSVMSAKFMSPIMPGQTVQIAWQLVSEGVWKVNWSNEDSSKALAKLNLLLNLS